MLTDFQPYGNACNEAIACARCDIKISCSEMRVKRVAAKSCGGLAMAPGTVSDCGGGFKSTEIVIPPCTGSVKKRLSVEPERPGRTICGDSGQPGGCCAPECIWTSTEKHSSVPEASVGDTITYTVTFTNHSSVALNTVRIFDDVPYGVSVKPDSISPAPLPGEALKTGISMGSVAAGSSAALIYSAVVNTRASGCLKNYAHAEYCYTDCAGCCRRGIGGRRSSAVEIIPFDVRLAVRKFADKKTVCSICEKITYTLVVSNPGSETLTGVTAYDAVPHGLYYETGSTRRNNGAPADENPQDGIYIGTLRPGEAYTVTFILIVCAGICRCGFPGEFINSAYAEGRCGRKTARAESAPWIVGMNGKHRCRCVQRCFSIGDYKCLRALFVHYRDAVCIKTRRGYAVSAGYGVEIKYLSRHGERKSEYTEGRALFFLHDEIGEDFTFRFTDIVLRDCGNGNIKVKFDTNLCYCAGTPDC